MQLPQNDQISQWMFSFRVCVCNYVCTFIVLCHQHIATGSVTGAEGFKSVFEVMETPQYFVL
jgi:hypothetical protein